MKFMSSMSLASLALVAAACGGGKDDPKVPLIDAPPQQMDAPAVQCTAEGTLASVTNPYYEYTKDRDMNTTGDQEVFFWSGDLNTDTLVDWINVELYEGNAPGYSTLNFPPTPFTINLTGAELSYSSCSTCVRLLTDVDLENSQQQLAYGDDYFATSGMVTITTATATNISGTLTNVVFKHVDFDDNGVPTANASGCTATLASASFEGMVMEPPPGGRARMMARVHRK